MRIFNHHGILSKAAADLFIAEAGAAITERGRFLVAFSGGTTPIALYRLLVKAPIDWAHVHVFWGDERCVPVDDVSNNYGQARDALLSHVAIPAENIHRIESELKPAEAAEAYIQVLKGFAEPPLDWPRFDLVLLGMGPDGHTASLFPGSDVNVKEPVVAVTGDSQDRAFERVTLTPVVINAARHVVFLVSGKSKSEVLADVLKGEYHPDRLPAQRIQPTDGKLTWLVDAKAGANL